MADEGRRSGLRASGPAGGGWQGGNVRFTPVTPARLVDDLVTWMETVRIDDTARGGAHRTIGIDGAAEAGGTELADAVAERIRSAGRPVIRISTQWWWRPASLRLELGRTDVDMLLYGWVDSAALRREVLEPLGTGGSGSYLPRLRDPQTDRSVRDRRVAAGTGAVVILDGPFLLAAELGLDAVVHLQVSPARLTRVLPPERHWWVEAFERYRTAEDPAAVADVVIAYDHPQAPAIRWGPEH